MMKMMNIPYNNYKTQLCRFWVQEGKCKFNKNCSYAHGEQELRKPYEPLPKDINAAFLKSSISGNYSGAPAGPTPSKEMTKNANYLDDQIHQEQINRLK